MRASHHGRPRLQIAVDFQPAIAAQAALHADGIGLAVAHHKNLGDARKGHQRFGGNGAGVLIFVSPAPTPWQSRPT